MILLLLYGLGFGPQALAGVIRHDRNDSQYTALAAQAAYSGVGDMIIDSSTRCSGTVISSNWVLTAAHCVDGSTNNVNFAVGGTTYSAVDWIMHANWQNDVNLGWDIALVEFTQSITGVNIAELYSPNLITLHGNEAGNIGTNVGFGRSGTGQTGDTTGSGTKRAGNNNIDGFASFSSGAPSALLQDFDNPLNAGDSNPLDLEYLIAPGDSGGGLFIEQSGNVYLAGVHSATGATDGNINSDYGDIAISTRVSSFFGWINDNTSSAGSSSVPAPDSLALLSLGLIVLGLWVRKLTR